MIYRPLGQSALNVSALGIGGLHFGVFLNQEMTERIIHRALDRGVNFIDTAPQYGQGHSETFIKNAVRGRRNKVYLTTKVGLVPTTTSDGHFGVATVPLSAECIRSSLEKSLQALGTDHVDLYQAHAFDASVPLEETLAALNGLITEGKVRHIGCSNYEHTQLELAAQTARKHGGNSFESFQVHYNLLERRAEENILPACERLKVGIIVNRGLARGILSGQYQPGQPPPDGSRAAVSRRVKRWLEEPALKLVQRLAAWSRSRGYTVAELALAWLLTRPPVSSVLVGMRTPEQLETCLRAVEWNLSPDDLQQIDQLTEASGLVSQVHSRPEVFFEQ